MDVKIKNALLSIGLFVISLTVSVGLLEIYVRLVETDGSNFDIEMWRYARDLKKVSDVAAIGHEHVPGKSGVYMGVAVKINSARWRDYEHAVEKSKSTTRIMMLGDSLMYKFDISPTVRVSGRLV